MKRLFPILLFCCIATHGIAATFSSGSPSTTNNDDSCDIATLPAATLLLPYFEVDFSSPAATAQTTLFTIVNASQRPQIARVTLWTDWAYPVLSFNVFLTGYDAQGINLYDILGPRGVIIGPQGTSSDSDIGERSLPNSDNPNFLPHAETACSQLPGTIPAVFLTDIRNALTTGMTTSCNARIGGTHVNASGYATIDVVGTCGVTTPADAAYYDELLYDNVLTGDYQLLDPDQTSGNLQASAPLVHIRAVPEGGPAGVIQETNLPYTFYDRYTPRTQPGTSSMDRRQPLPSTFATRIVEDRSTFSTELLIWREGMLGGGAACSAYQQKGGNAFMQAQDMVRFDEHENPASAVAGCICVPETPAGVFLPAASRTPTSGGTFPGAPQLTGDTGGWMYLNLNNGGSTAYTAKPGRNFAVNGTTVRPSQNWVVTTMSAGGRFRASFDATPLANGCTPPAPVSSQTVPLAPGPNATP